MSLPPLLRADALEAPHIHVGASAGIGSLDLNGHILYKRYAKIRHQIQPLSPLPCSRHTTCTLSFKVWYIEKHMFYPQFSSIYALFCRHSNRLGFKIWSEKLEQAPVGAGKVRLRVFCPVSYPKSFTARLKVLRAPSAELLLITFTHCTPCSSNLVRKI